MKRRSEQKAGELRDAATTFRLLEARAARALRMLDDEGIIPVVGMCGYRVEADGVCEHGRPSVLLAAGLV